MESGIRQKEGDLPLSGDCKSWKIQLEELKNDENFLLQKLIIKIQQYIG